jgi:hypothetical protein
LASGVLIATGAFGYLNYLELLDQFLTARLPAAPGPGRAIFIGLLGTGVVLIAGVIARAENRAGGPGHAASTGQAGRATLLIAKVIAVAAAIAVAVGTFYQYIFSLRPSAPVSLVLSVIATFTLDVAGPVILAVGASLTVVGRRDPDRPFAAGVLITGGILSLVYFNYSHVLGWLIPLRGYFGWAIEGADIGVGASLAMALAGILLLTGVRDLGQEPAFSGFAPFPQPLSETTRYLERQGRADRDDLDRRAAGRPRLPAADRPAGGGHPHRAGRPGRVHRPLDQPLPDHPAADQGEVRPR